MDYTKIVNDIILVSWSLFKVMIPTLIVVKIGQETGVVDFLNWIFTPVTELIGLPGSLTIVLTTTILTNPYAGLIILASTGVPEDITIAQTSVMASFMLFTHALPIELAISRQAGTKILFLALIRIITAILYCILINFILTHFDILQEPATVTLLEFKETNTLLDWVVEQIKGLIFIQIIIIALIILIEFLKAINVEKLITTVMKPFLKFLGIKKTASTIVVVGLTIGLGFGGGLMIKEVRQGKVQKRDSVNALVFINLFHSLIEDTSLLLLLGPSITIILFCRALFVLVIVYFVIKILRLIPERVFDRLFVNQNAFKN